MQDSPARIRLSHLLVSMICLVLAVITICAQLDRQSRFRPELARLVPSPFRSFAQAAIVQKGIAQGVDPAILYHDARLLLLRRPIAEENLTLFGMAAAKAGDINRSLQALDLAASRGWHGEMPQYLALVAAARIEQWAPASLRMRALLQTQASDPVVKDAIARFSVDDEGRSAIALMLAENPAFQYRLVSIAQSSLPPKEFDLLIRRFERHRTRIDCQSLATLISRWLDHGIGDQSGLTWDRLCASDRRQSSQDLRFAQETGDASPFKWMSGVQSGLSIEVDARNGGLTYHVEDGAPHRIAVRRMALPPGEQHFTIEGHPTDGNNYPLLRLRCVTDGRSIRLMPSGGEKAARIATLPQGCPVQRLELIANTGGFAGLKLQYH